MPSRTEHLRCVVNTCLDPFEGHDGTTLLFLLPPISKIKQTLVRVHREQGRTASRRNGRVGYGAEFPSRARCPALKPVSPWNYRSTGGYPGLVTPRPSDQPGSVIRCWVYHSFVASQSHRTRSRDTPGGLWSLVVKSVCLTVTAVDKHRRLCWLLRLKDSSDINGRLAFEV